MREKCDRGAAGGELSWAKQGSLLNRSVKSHQTFTETFTETFVHSKIRLRGEPFTERARSVNRSVNAFSQAFGTSVDLPYL